MMSKTKHDSFPAIEDVIIVLQTGRCPSIVKKKFDIFMPYHFKFMTSFLYNEKEIIAENTACFASECSLGG